MTRVTLRAVIVAVLVLGAVLTAATTGSALVLAARSSIYEARQDVLLDRFGQDARALLTEVGDAVSAGGDGASTGGTATPYFATPGAWDGWARSTTGRSLVTDRTTGATGGELGLDAVPARLRDGWGEQNGGLRYLRADLDGQLVFFVATSERHPVQGRPHRFLVVTAYSLRPEQDQVRELLRTAVLLAAGTATGLGALGWFIGSRLTRPLKRLRSTAQAVGAGVVPDPVPSVFRDVTDLGSALRTSATRLAASMAELRRREGHSRRLVSDVAHELRTPLASMVAVSEILDDEHATPAEQRLAVDVVRGGTTRLAALVEQLLEASRLDAGVAPLRVGEADLADVLREVAASVDPLGANDLRITCRAGLRVRTDVDRVRTVVTNLLQNAVRHGAPPVRVVVREEAAGGVPAQVVLTVTDSGPGIAAADAERVFEPFVVLDGSRSREGSNGLGLPIARDNARLLGGDLELVPSPGGTTVRLTFPAGIEEPPAGSGGAAAGVRR